MGTAFRLTALVAVGGILAASLAGCSVAASTRQRDPGGAARSGRGPDGGTGQAARKPASQPAFKNLAVKSTPTRIAAKAGVLADPRTLRLLWSRQPYTERPIGSLAEVMTALVVLRTAGLNRQIRIPRAVLGYVAKYHGESAGLHPGDVLTVRDLLEALLVESACDAAYVLATTFGPGIGAFVAKMNAAARQLGMMHTQFTSPDGLPYPTQYSTFSTPADLLTLGLAAMKSSVFRSIVARRFYQVRKSKGQHHAYWWGNTNALIGSYRGADGIKTGYTDAALHCLLFEAARHDVTLIGVVLGSPATGPEAAAQAAARLLNWGFSLKLAPGGPAMAHR